jgi:hypothetical protein
MGGGTSDSPIICRKSISIARQSAVSGTSLKQKKVSGMLCRKGLYLMAITHNIMIIFVFT